MEIQPGPQHAGNFIHTMLKNPGDENLKCVTRGCRLDLRVQEILLVWKDDHIIVFRMLLNDQLQTISNMQKSPEITGVHISTSWNLKMLTIFFI